MGKSAPAWRIPVAVILLTILLGGVRVAGGRFVADASKEDAQYFIERWRAGRLVLAPARLDELQAQLNRGLAVDSENAKLEEDLARLLAWRAERASLVDPVVRARLAEMRDRCAHAAALRPTSERAWASVAASRYLLGQIDAEFAAAMELSLRYGPWNQGVQMNVIRVGLAAWTFLPATLQAQLRQAIHRQAHWRLSPQAAALRTAITAAGRKELLCLLEPAPTGCAP